MLYRRSFQKYWIYPKFRASFPLLREKLTLVVGDMASFKLSGTIGAKGQNKPNDMLLFTAMLAANGYSVKVSNKLGGDAKTALQKAQIKFGKLKRPTFIIEPKNDPTFKGLLPAYEKSANSLAKQKFAKIDFKGGGNSEQWMTEAQYNDLRKKVVQRVQKIAKIYRSQFLFHKQIVQEYDDIEKARQGLMKAFTHVATMKAGNVKPPNVTLMKKTGDLVDALFKEANAGSLAKFAQTLPNVEKLMPRFLDDVQRFLKDFSGSAGSVANILKVTSTVAFGIVGAMAVPVLVAAGSVSTVAAATVAAGGGVKVVESASNELGRYSAGEKMSVSGSLKNIAIDGMVGALCGGIASKFPTGFVDKAANSMGSNLANLVGKKVSSSTAAALAKKYLVEASSEAVKETATQAIELAGKSIKNKKMPTQKDAEEAMKNVAYKFVSAGFLKSTKKFEAKLAYSGKDMLTSKILPDAFSRAGKNIKVPDVMRAKIIKNVTSKLLEDFTKVGYDQGVQAMANNKSPEDAASVAASKAASSSKIKARADALILAEMKKAKLVK
jgi:hypothetical protein